jgi:hypothetical protein
LQTVKSNHAARNAATKKDKVPNFLKESRFYESLSVLPNHYNITSPGENLKIKRTDPFISQPCYTVGAQKTEIKCILAIHYSESADCVKTNCPFPNRDAFFVGADLNCALNHFG